mmetsp:Transcript_82256/g.246562  ORF Transcript_82256/g.246562 Transcript_82256/m.246562 type:complete len:406 (-) Transcript_82256:148-1365(-)
MWRHEPHAGHRAYHRRDLRHEREADAIPRLQRERLPAPRVPEAAKVRRSRARARPARRVVVALAVRLRRRVGLLGAVRAALLGAPQPEHFDGAAAVALAWRAAADGRREAIGRAAQMLTRRREQHLQAVAVKPHGRAARGDGGERRRGGGFGARVGAGIGVGLRRQALDDSALLSSGAAREQRRSEQREKADADDGGGRGDGRHGEHAERRQRRLRVLLNLRVEYEVGRGADEGAHAAEHRGERERHQQHRDVQPRARRPRLARRDEHGDDRCVVQKAREESSRPAQPQHGDGMVARLAEDGSDDALDGARLLERARDREERSDREHRRRAEALERRLVVDDAREEQCRRRAEQDEVGCCVVTHGQQCGEREAEGEVRAAVQVTERVAAARARGRLQNPERTEPR